VSFSRVAISKVVAVGLAGGFCRVPLVGWPLQGASVKQLLIG
jgi:hypothetical protein